MSDKNNKDKINLTDLNKQKKSFTPPSLKNPFKKQTGPNRDDVGKFATTAGGGGLKSIKKFNWKRAAPLIAIVTLVGGFLVFQSFASGPRPSNGVLRRIYAEQMIPRGYSGNEYLQQFVHTGTGTQNDGTGGRPVTIIDPVWTQASGRWEDSWPDKIKVCAITYHQLQNNETTVQLSVGANIRYNKVKILQKLKNLNPPNKWPKQELCSDPIPRTYTQPATAGNPGGTFGPARSFTIYMKTVSVCAKQGERLTMVSDERCYTSSFQNDDHKKYPPYVPYVEQYIIKKAR
ncbi:MAG: hypothetical protein QG659_674 [Patescibacteria group bacterium]|jgi:hypothetical protein|nr:hypothetical protein [Patescibacteria group bacterium]